MELHRLDVASASSSIARTLEVHTESCRCARFIDGSRLATTSADQSVATVDVESGTRLWSAALGAAGNALLPIGGARVVVGDDDGAVSLFDVGNKKPVLCISEHSDFVTDMTLGPDGWQLCTTSGDGTLAVFDIRKKAKKALVAMSDFQDDEYLSLALVREGKKVVCGSQSGALAIFTWGDFGDLKDRIVGHPMSVDSVVRLTEESVLTGSSDGRIRLVTVHHSTHGSGIFADVGGHGEGDDAFPMERLAVNAARDLFASASHGQPAIRVWHTGPVLDALDSKSQDTTPKGPDGEDPDSDSSAEGAKKKKKLRRGKKRRKVVAQAAAPQKGAAAGFFRDL